MADVVDACCAIAKDPNATPDIRQCSAAWQDLPSFRRLPFATEAVEPTQILTCFNALMVTPRSPGAVVLIRDPRHALVMRLMRSLERYYKNWTSLFSTRLRYVAVNDVSTVLSWTEEERNMGLVDAVAKLVAARAVCIVLPPENPAEAPAPSVRINWNILDATVAELPGALFFTGLHPHVAQFALTHKMIIQVPQRPAVVSTHACPEGPFETSDGDYTHITLGVHSVPYAVIQKSHPPPAKYCVEAYIDVSQLLQHPLPQHEVAETSLRHMPLDPPLPPPATTTPFTTCPRFPPLIAMLDMSALHVAVIGNNFMFRNTSLVELKLPADLTSIGDNFCQGCVSFRRIHGLENKESQIGAFGRNFLQGSGIEEIKISIPKSGCVIGDHFAAEAFRLTFVDLSMDKGASARHQRALQMGSHALYACEKLTGLSILAEESEVVLGAYFANQCDALTKVDLSHCEITTLPPSSFYQCDELQEVSVCGSTTDVEARCFAECPRLCRVQFNSGNVQFGAECFHVRPLVDSLNGHPVKRYGAPDKLEIVGAHQTKWKTSGDGWEKLNRFPPICLV